MPGQSADEDFDAFYRTWWPASVRSARRIVGPAYAEEVAADAFVKAYVRWARVRLAPQPGAWVLRVTMRLGFRQVRRGARPLPGDVGLPASLTEDRVVTQIALVEALTRLPRRQREVVVLRHLADLNEQETAQALGISASTVKTHAQRGLVALRKQWGPDQVPDAGRANQAEPAGRGNDEQH